MIIGQSEYNASSGILGHFLPEWREHEHIPHRDEGVIESIMDDHSIAAFTIAKRVAQGVVLSVSCGALMNFVKTGQKKIVADRAALNPT